MARLDEAWPFCIPDQLQRGENAVAMMTSGLCQGYSTGVETSTTTVVEASTQ